MPASLNQFKIYYNVLKDALWLHLFYRKLLGPLPHLCQSKSILRNILFPSVLLFYVLPSTSFSFLKSLASSYILLSLWPEWQSLISKSSPAALHSGHQTWFEIQMLTPVIRFLLLCHLAQEREQLSTHPASVSNTPQKTKQKSQPRNTETTQNKITHAQSKAWTEG